VTISQLGSLGELIAAIATLATLGYLALQIRQNTRALRHAAERAALEDANSWRTNLIQNAEVAALYRKGLLDPDALDPIEKLRFRMLMDSLFATWQYQFRAGETGHAYYVTATLAQPGGERFWATAKSKFSPSFAAHIEDLNRSVGAESATS